MFLMTNFSWESPVMGSHPPLRDEMLSFPPSWLLLLVIIHYISIYFYDAIYILYIYSLAPTKV